MSRTDELMKLAFEASRRTWRSSEYKDGVRSVLEFRLSGRWSLPELPDAPGTAAADAFLAGMEEGWVLLRRFEQSDGLQVAAAECHLWIEEQRARVMELMAYRGPGPRLTRDMALPRSLIVMEVVQSRLPPNVPRYPWESNEAENHTDAVAPSANTARMDDPPPGSKPSS